MLTAADIDAKARALVAEGVTWEQQAALVAEVKESIELVHTSEYAKFLEAFLGPLQSILANVPPATQESPQHKLRHTVLEILNRLPSGEALRPRAHELIDCLHAAMVADNEDNALLCLRVSLDLHRNFRPLAEPKILSYMDWIKTLYGNVAQTYSHFFETLAAQPDAIKPLEFTPSNRSFKVLAETPLQVMFLFNVYPRLLQTWAQTLVPLMVNCVSLPGPEPATLPEKLRPAFTDLKNAQIKTLSFLTYLARSPSGSFVKLHQEAVAAALVSALQTCPDQAAMRKELLIAARHALTTTLKGSFFSKLDIMLDEAVLVGRGRHCQAELRPLAFSMLAELIHHTRQELTTAQLSRIIYIFSRNIHDDSLASSVQCTSVRLLLNLVEIVFGRRNDVRLAEQHRMLLGRVLDAFVSKLSVLQGSLPRLLGPAQARKARETGKQSADKSALPRGQSGALQRGQSGTLQKGQSGTLQRGQSGTLQRGQSGTLPAGQAEAKGSAKEEPSPDTGTQDSPGSGRTILHTMEKSEHEKEVSDSRNMLNVLVMGMKTLLYSLANYGNTAPPRPGPLPPAAAIGLRDEEVRLAARAVRCGLPCLRLSAAASRSPSERDINIYDSFADMFSVISDPRDVVEMTALQMGFMFRATLEDPRLLRVYMCLLNSSAQRHFASVLLQFLLQDRLSALQRPESKEGQLTLKLCMLFLEALKKYPANLEPVLLPLFPGLINKLVQLTTEAEEKTGFIDLMLQLFRTLTTGNFEAIYLVFGGAAGSPALLPSVLNLLTGILDGPNSLLLRDKVTEACLITPARLSEQLAGLPKLMKPLALAMEGGPELTAIAMRTLEYWVDSLNPEFLEPATAGISDRLLAALAGHLRLPPYPLGSKALQLLGKLGGRNRKSKDPASLAYRDNTEHGLRVVLTFPPSTTFLMPLDRILHMCQRLLEAAPSAAPGALEHRREALHVMHICAATILNLRSPLDSALPGRSADKLTAMLFGPEAPPRIEPAGGSNDLGVKTRMQLLSERQTLKSLLGSLIGCGGDPELADAAEPFAMAVSRHFALLYCAGTGNVRGPEGKLQKRLALRELDTHVYLEALVEVLAHEDKRRSGAALKCMKLFVTTLLEVAHAQRRLHMARLAAAVDGDGEASKSPSNSPAGDATKSPSPRPGPAVKEENQSEAGSGQKDAPRGSPRLAQQKPPAVKEGAFPPVLDDFMGRLIHCCYSDSWSMRFGGATAMLIVGGKLPLGQLVSKLAPCTKALLAVLRGLPKHAAAERRQLRDSLEFLIRRCLIRSSPAQKPAANPAQPAGGSPSEQGEDVVMQDAPAPEDGSKDGTAAEGEAGEDVEMADAGAAEEGENEAGSAPEPSTDQPDRPPQAPRRPAIRPAAEERAINNVVHVAAMSIFNARGSEELRSAADLVLKLVGEATGKTTARLLGGIMDKLQPPLAKRRLLPVRHVPQQAGYAAGLTYCLQQQPPLLTLTPEVVGLIRDACTICEQDSALLVQTLASSARQAAVDNLPALRSACLRLVCAAMTWRDFRWTPSAPAASPEAKPSESEEPDKEPDKEEEKEKEAEREKEAVASPSGYKDNGELGALRNQITQLLFRQLTSTDKAAVELAQEGLAALIASQKMPKQLLQTSLRPILANLAFYNKLKLPVLQGLARLLQLLASWFNLTLGEKLIDHLKKWLEPEKMAAVSKAWDSQQDAEVAATILDLFHMLPSQAVKFLETSQERPGLVVLTIELEKALSQTAHNMQPTKMWSPYREPLTKYLNKYSSEATSYFLDTTRMAMPTYFLHFLDVLRSELGKPLLTQLAASSDKILALLSAPADPNPQVQQMQTDAQFNALHLLAVMVKLLPDWLPESLFRALHARWKSPERHERLSKEESLARSQALESKWLAKCLLAYIRRNRGELGPLFDLLDIFGARSRVSFVFLRDFLSETMPATFSLDERRQVFMHFLDAYAQVKSPQYSQQQLVSAAKLIIRPMLEKAFDAGEKLLNTDILGSMVKHIFDAPEDISVEYEDAMHIEMLQIASLLIRRAPEELVDNRKELIRFGWNHLKRDDSAAKFYAFLNVCYFLEAYQAPEKIVLQVFVALLRACQQDSRKGLVRQALDVLTPALVRRLSGSDARKPVWVRYVRKVLMEEGHSLSNMLHIWQLLVRHADLFYSSRVQFVSQMVNSLVKLGLPSNASLENRRLAIDLAGLVVYWEQRRLRGPPPPDSRKRSREEAELQVEDDTLSKQVKLEGTPEAADVVDMTPPQAHTPPEGENLLLTDGQPSRPPSAGPSGRPSEEADSFKPPPQMQEIVVSFLSRMAFLLGDATKEPEYMVMHKHTLQLLKDALEIWPQAPVKLNYMEKLIGATALQDPPPAVVTGLQVMDKVLAVQPQLFVQNSVDQFCHLIGACFKVKHQPVIKSATETLKAIYTCFPPSAADNPAKALQDRVQAMVAEQLRVAGTAAVLAPGQPFPEVCAAVSLVRVLAEVPGGPSPTFLPHLVTFLARVAQDNSGNAGLLLAAKTPALQRLPKDAVATEPEYGTIPWAVCEIIPLTRGHVNALGDQKRAYLQAMLALVTGPAAAIMDPAVLLAALQALKLWILDPSCSQVLQEKDAIIFLQRFAKLQHEGRILGQLKAKFETTLLDLLYTVCTAPGHYSPQFQKDAFEQVERPHMLGLQSGSRENRQRFFRVYHKAIPNDLFERLKFILCVQDWEKLAGKFWLKQALDLILANLMHSKEAIKLAPNSAQIPVLLSKTKQNLFNMREQQESAAAAAAAARGPAPTSAPAALPPPTSQQLRPILTRPPAQYAPGQPGYPMQQQPGLSPQMSQQMSQPMNVSGAPGVPPMMAASPTMQQPQMAPQGMAPSPGMSQPPNMSQPPPGMSQPMGMSHPQLSPAPGQQPGFSMATPQQPGMLQSMPMSAPTALPVSQPGVSHPQGLPAPGIQHMFARPHQSLAQLGLQQQFLQQMQRPMQPQMQQVGGPRPAGFPQGQPSVAQQLLSQPPIAAVPGQTVLSQQQFMAGAAQMASRPLSTPIQQQPRPQQLQAGAPGAMGLQAQPGTQLTSLAAALAAQPHQFQPKTSLPPGQQPGMGQPGALPSSQPPQQPVLRPQSSLGPQQMASTPMQGHQAVVMSQQMAAMQRQNLQRAAAAAAAGMPRPQAAQTPSLSQPMTPQNSLPPIKQEEAPPAGPKDDGTGERDIYKELQLPARIDEMMHEHCRFLVQQGGYKNEELLQSIGEVMIRENEMSYYLWVLIFPIVWSTLSDTKEKQIHLAKPIITLLSREFHKEQMSSRPNVVQALMEGISLSQPQPKIPSELIKYLGKSFNAWHIAVPLLESHVMLFPQETRCFDALAELYSALNEEDVLFGLLKRRCSAAEARSGLAYLQHGDVESAQDAFAEAMEKFSKHADTEGGPAKPGKSERVMWQAQYTRCCAEMSQWETMLEYGRQTENYAVITAALAKTQDWKSLKEDVLPVALLEETADTHMVHAYVHLQEGSIMEGDAQTNLAISKALEKRWMLPEVGTWPQLPLLAQFQQIVELQESVRLLMDLASNNQRQDSQYRDLKDIMETWRLRTPNEWERFSMWSDVLIWRNQIYNIVINAFKGYAELHPQLYQLGYRDKAWNVNRLGCIARKHGSPETAKYVINHLYGFNAMEVQEAFTKIREQSKCYLQQPELLANGLSLVNSQNLDYFQPHHQAELFRLKGIFLQEMGMVADANMAFSTSLTLCAQLPDGWLSWGTFCDAQYRSSKEISWLESAVTAYLQAVRQNSVAARDLLPRVLGLLSFDNETGAVGRAVDRGSRQVPHNVWLVWLPQLLTSLQRPEAPHVKRILVDLARLFPQALYYGLRTYLLTTREAAHKAVSERRAAGQQKPAEAPKPAAAPPSEANGTTEPAAPADTPAPASNGEEQAAPKAEADTPANPATQAGDASSQPATAPAQTPRQEKPAELLAFEAGREVMEVLRGAHAHICSVLEIMCTDIGQKFVAKPEERLLGVVHALLHRAYKLPYSNNAEVPPSLKKELAGVCRVCFSDDNASKHGRVVAQYKDQFLRDLNPEPNPNFPATLGDLAARLKAWRNTLQQTVEDTMDPVLRLEDESRALVDTSFQDVEMPGQYAGGEEIPTDGPVHIESFGADVAIIRRHGLSFRRLAFLGSNGRTRHFVVQSGQQWTSGDERLMQLLRMMNKLLDKHPESRSRQLNFSAPLVVPIWPQVRLIEEDPSYCSYGEAYEIHCARYGREADLPIVRFKQMCCTEAGQLLADPQGQRRMAAFQEITKLHVTENIFSQFMYKMLPTCNHLWAFKKAFCMQLALSGLLSHLLLVGGRSPNKLLFAKATGRLYQMEFYPTYDGHGVMERNEPVPFRLTRNLHTFFTPFGVEGVFVASLAVAAQALLGRHSNLGDVLAMFLRDDILAWMARRSGRPSSAGVALGGSLLADMVRLNSERGLERLRQLCPKQPPPGESLAADPQRGVHELVAAAVDPRNLCKMDPTWQPWF